MHLSNDKQIHKKQTPNRYTNHNQPILLDKTPNID